MITQRAPHNKPVARTTILARFAFAGLPRERITLASVAGTKRRMGCPPRGFSASLTHEKPGRLFGMSELV
jgi:hypothetical protein